MRIALDFDGVIHDITAVKQRYARLVHGLELDRADVWRPRVLDHLTEDEHRALVAASHTTPLGDHTEAMSGALEGIAGLAAEHDLYVITARTDEEVPFAREWLRGLGIPLRQIRHTRRQSKLEYCEALGVHLLFDDLPYVLRGLEGSAVRPVLLQTPYNSGEAIPAEVSVVPDWPSFVELCSTLRSDLREVLRSRQLAPGSAGR
jgi:uncharacterized HAD superfamily protein